MDYALRVGSSERPSPAESDTQVRGATGSPVFLAKLRPPPAAHLIRRERLITLVDDAPAVEISRKGAYAFSAMVFDIMIIAAATVLSR